MQIHYELRKGNSQPLDKAFEIKDAEKEDHNVNLQAYQWEWLDRVAENQDMSRNAVLRNLLDEFIRE